MLYLVLLFLIVLFLIIEKALHERRIKRIPIRIHVNGTRGKSSVVELVASSLRENGIRTLAKTTGTTPLVIDPDGHEQVVPRRGPSRIQEQVRFVRKAARMKVDAMVVECMALDPQLQWVSEMRMIQSTIGVITNVRQDHFEAMGKGLDDIAESLGEGIPENGILVTADRHYFDVLSSKARRKNTRTYLAGETEREANPPWGHPLFFEENLWITQEVCSHLGLPSPAGLSYSRDEIPEKAHPRVLRMRSGARTFYLVDAFSANDIDSARIIQQMITNESCCPRPYVALLNNRADRPLRMLSFASFLSQESIYDLIIVTGDLQRMTKRVIRREGGRTPLVTSKSQEPGKLIEEIGQNIPSAELTIVGMGNFRGAGERLSRFFRERGRP